MVWKKEPIDVDGYATLAIARMDRKEPRTVPTERDANARLMAQAPELRRILSDLLQDFCYMTVQRSRASLQATEILKSIDRGNR
jgi:hypothetical protein